MGKFESISKLIKSSPWCPHPVTRAFYIPQFLSLNKLGLGENSPRVGKAHGNFPKGKVRGGQRAL